MKSRIAWMTAGLLGVALSAGLAVQVSQGGLQSLPTKFSSAVTNAFFPLSPGTTFQYQGERNGAILSEDVFVTHDTRTILGADCTVVQDTTSQAGTPVEESHDFYAQDERGNVWIFGAEVRQLDPNGNVIGNAGSWLAGEHGAQPGIVMPAAPKVGDTWKEEDAPGVAVEIAHVVSDDKTVTVPFGTFANALAIATKSPLELGVVERSYYAEHLGLILVVGVKGEKERMALVNVTTGG